MNKIQECRLRALSLYLAVQWGREVELARRERQNGHISWAIPAILLQAGAITLISLLR